MPNMYFAKINVNSNIYEVYKNPEMLDKILNNLLLSINQEEKIQIDGGDWIKFIHLDKDIEKRFIVGRLVKIFEDDIEIYDAEKDDVKPLSTKELAKSVTFYFDLRSEIVAFTTGRSLGYQQFVRYFNELINKYSKDAEFEVFLKKNSDVLNQQIKQLKSVSKVDITLVPPNSNEEEFDDLFPKSGDEIKETKATKIQQLLSAPKKSLGMNIESSYFKRIINGVVKGFGTVTVTGKNRDGEERTITSEKDAPQKRFIPNTAKNSIPAIKEFGRAYIVELLAGGHQKKE